MENTKISRLLTAGLVVGSIVGTYFFAGPRNKKRQTDVVEAFQEELDTNLITPANATFATVWPVIYAGTLGLAVHQALPSQADNRRYDRAAPWLVANYLLNGLFGVFFSRGEKVARVGANLSTVATLPTVLALHQSLEVGRADVPEPERTFHRAVSLYAGWITVATGVATTSLLIESGWREPEQRATPYAVGLLGTLGTIGVAVSRQLNDPFYLLPFVAGFTGVAAKQWGRNNAVAGVAGTLALTALGAFAQGLRTNQVRPEPRRYDAGESEQARQKMAEEPQYVDMD